jgi:hypothetical protein
LMSQHGKGSQTPPPAPQFDRVKVDASLFHQPAVCDIPRPTSRISSISDRLGYIATCSTSQRHGAQDQARIREETMEHAVRRRSPRRKQDRIILHFVRIHPHTISPQATVLTPIRITTASTHRLLRMPSLRSDLCRWVSSRRASWQHATTRPGSAVSRSCSSSLMPRRFARIWSSQMVRTYLLSEMFPRSCTAF